MMWKRREFLGVSAAGLAGVVLPGRLVSGFGSAGEFSEIRRNVGIFTSRGGTIGWLLNPSGALVVDSQFPDPARECVEGLAERGGDAIDALINSHHHGDHTAGNGVFRPVARMIVAHRRAPELQRRSAETAGTLDAQTFADTTFDREWAISVGDETVSARHYGPAHTGGDCTIHFQQANIVHMGDLVFNRAYPFIDRPGGASVQGWIDLLETVAGEHSADTVYVFGHANPDFGVIGNRSDVLVQRDYLSGVLETARRSLAEGKSREEATALESLPEFPDHRALNPRLSLAASIGVAYDELTER